MNEYQQMVKDLAKPGQDIINSLTPLKAHALHMAVGLSGEVAELKEHQVLLLKGMGTNESTVLEELGDIEFYFEGLCQVVGGEIPSSTVNFPYPLSVDHLVVAAGNLLDTVKKQVIYNKDISVSSFTEQLLNVRECLDQAYSYYGLTSAQAREHNLNKLLKGANARYKAGAYSDEAAQLRVDKAGTIGIDPAQEGSDTTIFYEATPDKD